MVALKIVVSSIILAFIFFLQSSCASRSYLPHAPHAQKLCEEEGLQFYCWLLGRPVQVVSQITILQGPGTDRELVVNALVPGHLRAGIIFWLKRADHYSVIKPANHRVFESENFELLTFRVHGQAHETLEMAVVSSRGELLDLRQMGFHKGKSRLRFVVASCMDDAYLEDGRKMWKQIESLIQDPIHPLDALFLIGDNAYVSASGKGSVGATPSRLIRRHIETRLALPLYRFRHLIPTYSVWDDNDYGLNNGDRTYRFREVSRDLFESLFALKGVWQENLYRFKRGPGVASVWITPLASFAFLDNRYFRTSAHEVAQSHFGSQQNNWLRDLLNPSDRPVALISGDQFFGGYHPFESFEGSHKKGFHRFLELVRESQAKVFFLSGDRHLTEIMKVESDLLGYETFEVTSSPMHGKVYPQSFKKYPNPRQLMGRSGVLNFADVRLESKGEALRVQIRVLGPTETLYETTLHLQK